METTTKYRYVDGVEDGIDFDAHYKIPGYEGVAWRLSGWAQTWENFSYLDTLDENGNYDPDGEEVEVESNDGEWIDDHTRVVAIMVGDDRRFEFDREEPVLIAETDFCRGCGSTSCGCEVWE